ncbi:DUF2961 domain-containing protein [Oceanispirochaeta sp. M2]|nr:DUF2961 domain-containing protein [Oceanispirochaeta sp. M2]NPD73030.1 DUF2961 domain-containing protein [Oceanispirochaeta sp. M1]RDG31419.1 DUF2961 domain-containing protein [Oceanispirochaeta sp. M1]
MAEVGTGLNPAGKLGKGWKISPSIVIPSGETFTLADIQSSGIIRHIWITTLEEELRSYIIRFYWDDNETPSVECPLGDFFASGLRTIGQIDSLPVCVNPKRAFNCYWLMPFKKSCRIEIENRSDEDLITYYQIDYTEEPVPEDSLYFHANFNRINPLPSKEVYWIADKIEGVGRYVGTYMTWGVNNSGWWGEGEMKAYIDDDKEYPTICGTGTEDYFCGSYNFEKFDRHEYQEFSTAYSGMPVIEYPDGVYSSQMRFSMYRWHISDPILFKSSLKISIQALGWTNWHKDQSKREYLPLQDDLSSVAFWYQNLTDKPLRPLPADELLQIN